ncbi:kinase-like protein [Panus rudis PR-1116 ss-1]|nr:kinase-like protein [Panus rudis PR-1116 ss-1]
MVSYAGERKGTKVAVKMLRIHRSRRIRLLYEQGVIWPTLRHPHILPVLGFIRDSLEETPTMLDCSFVVPWLRHGNILTRLSSMEHQEHMPPFSDWLKQIISGIKYLHEEQLVHGSLRGSNVLIDENNVVKLADYGTSPYVEDEHDECGALNGVEMSRWMAPEKLSLDLDQVFIPSPQHDIYAFGCLWIELHSRRPPFPDYTDHLASLQVLKGSTPQLPSQGLIPPVTTDQLQSQPIWRIVRQCLSTAPEMRPSIHDLESTLDTDTYWIRQAYSDPASKTPGKLPDAVRVRAAAEHRTKEGGGSSIWGIVRTKWRWLYNVFEPRF